MLVAAQSEKSTDVLFCLAVFLFPSGYLPWEAPRGAQRIGSVG